MAIVLNGLTGITTPAVDTDGLSVDTDVLFVDAVSNNVGIGESSPEARLHVANDQGGAIGRVLIDANVSSGYDTRINATDLGLEFTAQSNGRGFVFNTGATPTEKVRITSTGNVGIGTSTITEALTVEGNIRSNSSIRTSGLVAAGDATAPHFSFSANSNMGMFRQNSNTLGFSTNGAERLRITSAGTLQSPGGSAFTGTVATGSTLGAIIQRGSNSNGEFVRFADGTQICTARSPTLTTSQAAGPIFRSPDVTTVTFAASFVSVPEVSTGFVYVSGSASWEAATFGPFTGSVGVRIFNPSSSASKGAVSVTAIGRWF